MFRPMRRKNQLLPESETIRIFETCPTGILAVHGDDGYPYAVPLNFAYKDGRIYFHCAREGHKLDGLRQDSRISFCVVEEDRIVPRLLATDYRSAIAFGRAKVLTDDGEIRRALDLINGKYASAYPEEARIEIEKALKAVICVEITVEHMTGKAASKSVQGQNGSPSQG